MDKKYWDKIYETYNVEIFDVLKSDRNDVKQLLEFDLCIMIIANYFIV